MSQEGPEASPAGGAGGPRALIFTQMGLPHFCGVLSGFGRSPANISQSCLYERSNHVFGEGRRVSEWTKGCGPQGSGGPVLGRGAFSPRLSTLISQRLGNS